LLFETWITPIHWDNITRNDCGMCICRQKASVAFDASCLSQLKGFKVTGRHVFSESSGISEMVQDRHVTTDH